MKLLSLECKIVVTMEMIMHIFATGIMLVILLADVDGNSIYFLLVKQYVNSKVTLIYKLNINL